MPEPTCAHTKPNGQPCAARPLPGSTYCLFHDPAHAPAQTEARSKGGSTPRRRLRRVPRLLDHYQIAELLGELFVDALNHANPTDPKCLNAITGLARTLLKAVGAPNDQYLEHGDWSEPPASADHLLRLYPALPPEVEALLEADPPCAAPLTSDPTDPTDPTDPPSATPDPATLTAPTPQRPNASTPQRLNAPTPECLTPEQELNRPGTGLAATDRSGRSAGDSLLPACPAAPPHTSPQEPATPARPAHLTTPDPQPASLPTPERLNASTPATEPDPPIQNPKSKIQNPEESPGISSLRRVIRHSPAGAIPYNPAPGCVICDPPRRP